MADITKSEILNIIKKVNDPKIKTDHLTLNSIKNFELKDNSITIDISVPGDEKDIDKDSYEKFIDAIKKEHPSLNEIHLNIQTTKPVVSAHIDAKKGTINVRLSKKELSTRRKKWKPRKSDFGSGTLWKYAQTVGPAYLGAPTHPGKRKEVKEYADI